MLRVSAQILLVLQTRVSQCRVVLKNCYICEYRKRKNFFRLAIARHNYPPPTCKYESAPLHPVTHISTCPVGFWMIVDRRKTARVSSRTAADSMHAVLQQRKPCHQSSNSLLVLWILCKRKKLQFCCWFHSLIYPCICFTAENVNRERELRTFPPAARPSVRLNDNRQIQNNKRQFAGNVSA